MAILRSVGARPVTILSLLVAEAGVLTLCGLALGTLLLYGALIALQPFIDRTYGLHIPIDPPTRDQLLVLGAIVEAGDTCARFRERLIIEYILGCTKAA
jgi:putative ABC transport system permease protein